jgi:hypothetical protein
MNGSLDRTSYQRSHETSSLRRTSAPWSNMTRPSQSIRSTPTCFLLLPSVEVISSFPDIGAHTKLWTKLTQSIYYRGLSQWKADIHNLWPFNYDPERTMALEVAQHNEQEFVVESIVGHRGNRSKRSTMKFKVRWAGFGESWFSWEPYKALLHVDKLHDYLRVNTMRTLIPSEHK